MTGRPGNPGNGWRTSYIKKILSNRAVLGEYQPHRRTGGKYSERKPEGAVIEGYFPRIISEKKFNAVQALLAKNKGKGGRIGNKLNIFTHLATCGYCGGPMRHVNKGKGWRYLACDRAARGVGCQYVTVRYMEAQDLILEACRHLSPAQVLPSTTDQQALIKTLRKREEDLSAALEVRETQIANGTDQILRTNDAGMRDSYEAHVIKLKNEASTLKIELKEAARELENATHTTGQFEEWQHALPELMAAIDDPDAGALRARLAAHLRNYIDQIEVFPKGYKHVANPSDPRDWETFGLAYSKGKLTKSKSGRKRRQVAVAAVPPIETIHGRPLEKFWEGAGAPNSTKAQRASFESWVLKRRMSKDGRFYRIRFTNGEVIDIAPPGGLATGLRLVQGRVEKGLPDFGRLWREFNTDEG